MAQQTRTTLKTYFNTGDTPTEAQFIDLIDSSPTFSDDGTPVYSGGALGTPSSGTATNLTGTAAGLTAGNVTTNANLTGHITSTGNAAVLGSFTKAQLDTAVSDATLQAQPSEGAFVDGDKTKLDGIEAAADVTDATNVAAAGASIITSGAGAPASTPAAVGDIYIDTTGDVAYVATGTVSSANWDIMLTGTAGATDTLAKWDANGNLVAATETSLNDPGADRIVFWDDSATSSAYLAPGAGLAITATTLDAEVSLAGTETLTNKTLTDPKITHTVNPQTGTTYTLVLTDQTKIVTMANASANTLTIPTNASVAFPNGSMVEVIMKGAGTTTVTGDTGVTVNGVLAGGATISAQYSGVTIRKIDTNEWIMTGNHGTVA